VPLYGPDIDLGHFILGIIDLNSSQITILDSLSMARNKRDYSIAFLALLEITNLIHVSGSMKFNLTNWKLVVSEDCAQQDDGINCGIFVILNVASMFVGHQLSGIEDYDRSRYWIHDLIIKFQVEDPKMSKERTLPFIENLVIEKIDILTESTRYYISNIIKDMKFEK